MCWLRLHAEWDQRMRVILCYLFLMLRGPPRSALFPYTTLCRAWAVLIALATLVIGAGTIGLLTAGRALAAGVGMVVMGFGPFRSEEHTSELQSRPYIVSRLLLEKQTSTATPA